MAWRWAALLLLLVPGSALAQPDDREDPDEIICIIDPGPTPWMPTADETRAIDAEPVPSSFSRRMEDGGCALSGFRPTELISWHLRFGSERSTTAALAYLEQQSTDGLPRPGDYPGAMRRAWRDARRVIEAGPIEDESHRLRRYAEIFEARGPYLDAAGDYLRAAEEFRSLPLLDRAEALVQAVDDGDQFLPGPPSDQPMAARRDDFRLRIAVLRASVTHAAADIATAREELAAAERPFYWDLAERAYSGGNELCDIEESRDSEALADACEGEAEMAERLTSYWVNRAALDLIEMNIRDVIDGRDEVETTRLALRLLERGADEDRDCCSFHRYDEPGAEFRLQALRVAEETRLFRDAVAQYPTHWWGLWVSTLSELGAMERFAPPFEAPSRFRRLAEAWLLLWRAKPTNTRVFPDERSSARRRHAAYLQALLPLLPRITEGENEPCPQIEGDEPRADEEGCFTNR